MGQRSRRTGLKVHSFEKSLAESHVDSDLPLWEQVYRQAFPDFQDMHAHLSDGDHQRQGIDRSIVLTNAEFVYVDEKLRRANENGKVYSDIALEYWSSFEKQTPGWVCKRLKCHYIAYAIGPLGRCYLLPTSTLQDAWHRYGESWKRHYPQIKAINEDYTTVSVGVPWHVLRESVRGARLFRFDAIGRDLVRCAHCGIVLPGKDMEPLDDGSPSACCSDCWRKFEEWRTAHVGFPIYDRLRKESEDWYRTNPKAAIEDADSMHRLLNENK